MTADRRLEYAQLGFIKIDWSDVRAFICAEKGWFACLRHVSGAKDSCYRDVGSARCEQCSSNRRRSSSIC